MRWALNLSIFSTVCILVGLASCSRLPVSTNQTLMASAAPPVDILTQHNDPQRTGTNTKEVILTPSALRSGRFGLLFSWKVDGELYAQPLYVSNYLYHGNKINILIAATANNSVYAFQAPAATSNDRPSASPLWHVGKDVLGDAAPFNFMNMSLGFIGRTGIGGHNIDGSIGIISTPVIDRERGLATLPLNHMILNTEIISTGYLRSIWLMAES